MTKLREKLKADLQEVEWSAIREHLVRDAVILVSQELDITEVGEVVAIDDKTKVTEWVTAGLISKPSVEQIEHWETEQQRKFLFLILSPFVLIQIAAN